MQDLNEFGAFVKNLSHHQNETKCLAIHSKISEIINATISKSNFMEQWQCEQAMIENGKTNSILLGKLKHVSFLSMQCIYIKRLCLISYLLFFLIFF